MITLMTLIILRMMTILRGTWSWWPSGAPEAAWQRSPTCHCSQLQPFTALTPYVYMWCSFWKLTTQIQCSSIHLGGRGLLICGRGGTSTIDLHVDLLQKQIKISFYTGCDIFNTADTSYWWNIKPHQHVQSAKVDQNATSLGSKSLLVDAYPHTHPWLETSLRALMRI